MALQCTNIIDMLLKSICCFKWAVYKRCGMSNQANGVHCGVVEWMKRNTLRWFGDMEGTESEKFVKKVQVSKNMGPNSRGRALGR